MVETDDAHSVIIVCTNCADKEEAAAIARACVGRRLAAAANIDAFHSIHRREDEVQERDEFRLTLKTVRARCQRVVDMIRDMHSSAHPAISWEPGPETNGGYHAWLVENSTGQTARSPALAD